MVLVSDSDDYEDGQDNAEDGYEVRNLPGKFTFFQTKQLFFLTEICLFSVDEVNWDEQRLAIVNVGRLAAVFPRILNDRLRGRHRIVLRNNDGNAEDQNNRSPGSSPNTSEDEADNPDGQSFDTQLPTQHCVSRLLKQD
jgi:hypothetical protein